VKDVNAVERSRDVASRRYVRENDHGRWDVLAAGQRRSPSPSDTKAEAVRRARGIVRREGGGEVRVMNRVGKVAETVTVAKTRR
jgi:hypothetical protein